jgi:mono/diheme cytochrome c family protein
MRTLDKLTALLAIACGFGAAVEASAQGGADGGKPYRIIEGKVDSRTYNGYRRYNAGCNHCHGPDGVGSTFASSLLEKVLDVEEFRRIVSEGRTSGAAVMKGFAADPNIAPYIDDIYAYLRARHDGELGRGRPVKLEQ